MNVNFQHANLRLLRQLHDNLPQKYVAHYLGVSQVAYCKMERGEVNVSLLHLRKICRLYQLPSDRIFYEPLDTVRERLLATFYVNHLSAV